MSSSSCPGKDTHLKRKGTDFSSNSHSKKKKKRGREKGKFPFEYTHLYLEGRGKSGKGVGVRLLKRKKKGGGAQHLNFLSEEGKILLRERKEREDASSSAKERGEKERALRFQGRGK